MELSDYPLVSVAVVTYNSSKTVLETLDSIAKQTYQNLELIVSDDCSSDNTVEICREWIASHKERFVRTELLTVDKNTGVSANVNRAEQACKGEWLKLIAGDDILLPNCISRFVEYVSKYPETVYVFSRVECFGGTPERRAFVEKRHVYDFFTWDNGRQLDFLIFEWNCVPTVTAFFDLTKAREFGITNDERIPLLEDHPKWINVLRKGVKLCFIDEPLVKYRVGEQALSTQVKFSKAYQFSMAKMFRYYQADAYVKRFGYIYTFNHYCNIRCLWSENALYWRVMSLFSKMLLRLKKALKIK